MTRKNTPIAALDCCTILRCRLPALVAGVCFVIAGAVLAKDDPNPVITLQTLSAGIADKCKTNLARELALISIHANDPLLEDNLDLATECGKQMILVYENEVQNRQRNVTRMRGDNIGPVEGLINFESPHVHPIDLTPDGNTLLAVNTAAHRLEVFAVNGSSLSLTASIPVGIDPVSVRARSNTEAWVVNHVSDSVSIVDLSQRTVIRTLNTDNEPADVVFAGSPQRAFVSASEANRINVFDLANLSASPQQITLDGEDPRALAVSTDGSEVYAAIFESGNNTGIIASSGFSGGGTIVRGVGLADNDVAIVDTANLSVTYRRGLMTMIMALAVHPITQQVHIVGTESLNDIETEPALNGVFLRVNQAAFNGNAGVGGTINDLNPHLDYSSPSVSSTLRQQSIGDPRGIAWRNSGQQAFITGMGSNNVVVVNNSGARVARISVGQGPTGIVLNDAAGVGFVMNKFSGSISVIGLNSLSEISEVSFDDPTPQVIKNGRAILYDTILTSGTGHVSCASCHVDARTDRLGWQLSDASAPSVTIPRASNSLPGNVIGSVTLNGNKDVMTTQTLLDIMEHPRFHWRGDRENIDDFNAAFTNLMGRSSQISAAQMTAFKDFLRTLWLPPNPYRNLDNTRPSTVTLPDGSTATSNRVGAGLTDALRGGGNNNNCLICHSGQANATRNFGVNPEIGSNVIAPALPGLYDKMGLTFGRSGFGFFHNGATDLFEATRTREFLAEILTLEGPEGPLQGNEIRQAPHAGMGRQLTINGNVTTAQNNLLNQFVSIANSSSWIELIALARINNRQRGFALISGNNFDADITDETQTLSQLLNVASNGDPVTFTLVATGMSTRLALDFDLDGERNSDGTQNEPPTLSITAPVNGAVFDDNEIVTLSTVATDPEDGNLSSAVTWSSSIDGNLGNISSISSLSVGSHVLTALVTDSEGVPASDATTITIEPGANCGPPSFDGSVDRALIVWEDCDGTIQVVAAGGGASAAYTGQIGSTQALGNLALNSVEATDSVTLSNDSRIQFDLTLGGGFTDGFSYSTAAGASSCLVLSSQSSGTVILAGRERTIVASPFDPVTQQACSLPPDSGCSTPIINPATESGVFVWQECDGPWQLMLTGIDGGGTVGAAGVISTPSGFNSVMEISTESSDTITQETANLLSFNLRTSNPWNDRFAFDLPDSDDLCIALNPLDAGLGVFAGADKTPVSGAFNPQTLASCTPATSACAAPVFDAANERALFSWIDCSGDLHLLATGAAASARFSGHVYATPPFTSVIPQSLEASDILDSSDATDVIFDVTTGGGPWFDEIILTPADNASMCVEVTLRSAGTALLAGTDRMPVTSPFNPETLEACTPPGDGMCGDPGIDSSSDAGLFVWKDCNNTWSLMVTGRDDFTSVNYAGTITSEQGFTSISEQSLEPGDLLSTSLNSPIDFNVTTAHPWADRFTFTADESSALCVTITQIPDTFGQFAGQDRTPVTLEFDPVTLGNCSN